MSSSKPTESAPKYNWSGHVTMDTATNGFFKENMQKAESIDLRFRHGLLTVPHQRNPLKAERSPRVRNTGFDFSIPPKAAEAERWIYPDTDRGLVSKLPSQKKIYQTLKDKEKQHLDNVKRLAAQQSAIFDKNSDDAYYNSDIVPSSASVGAQSVSINGEKVVSQSNYYKDSQELNKQHYSTEEQLFSSSASKKKSAAATASFYKQPISTFKSLACSSPEVLSDWRANRAAEFVAKLKNPLEPPAPKDVGPMPFRPAGGLTRSASQQDKSLQSTHSKSSSAFATDSLEKQLSETQLAIQQQKVKLSRLKV